MISNKEKEKQDVSEWTTDDVSKWLENVGLEKYVEKFRSHNIDGLSLLGLSEEYLKEEIKTEALDDLERLISQISKLTSDGNVSRSFEKRQHPLDFYSTSHDYPYEFSVERFPIPPSGSEKLESCDSRSSSGSSRMSFEDDFNEIPPGLQPDYEKSILACLYLIFSGFINSLAVVLIHNSMGSMNKYPPLPDLFLDNFPIIWWARSASEIIVNFLLLLCAVVICFHKYGSILIRRGCLIMGSMYLLRTVTISVTSLPPPSADKDCLPKYYNNVWDVLSEAGKILSRGGLQIHGVQTCGDYMFSGHTIALTFFSFFLIEYTPGKCYLIHLMAWMLNITGMILILLAHAHYSIDVIIAFFITARMFLCYHYLANNQPLQQQNPILTKIFYPLFSYFESDVECVVPNEYSNPFSIKNLKSMIDHLTRCFRNARDFMLEKYQNVRFKFHNNRMNV